MNISRRYRRTVGIAAGAIVAACMMGYFVYHSGAALNTLESVNSFKEKLASAVNYDVVYANTFTQQSIDERLQSIEAYKEFLSVDIFEPILRDDHIDRCALLNNGNHYVGGRKKGHYNGPMKESYAKDDVYTKEKLLDYLRLNDDEKGYIRRSHEYIMEKLPKQFPEKLEKMFEKNKNGYVYVGGGRFNYLALLALKSLRASGAIYPAEILLPSKSDFDVTLCNTVFPILNARCLIIEDYLPKETEGRVSKYQIKSVALILNSFQNVLLLDVDNMVIKNPDYLFQNEPFISNGLVTWPDLWRRSISPIFYDLADVTVDETKKVRNSYAHVVQDGKANEHGYTDEWKRSYHDYEGAIPEASTESGQIMVNKKTHLQSIFLSLYYNFHGPSYFYPLLSQNSHGEGDKETYIAAAHVLGQPYYQVEEYARDFHRDHDKVKRGFQRTILSIGQYDPAVEVRQSKNDIQDAWTSYDYSNKKSHWEFKLRKNSELIFLHCNGPKLFAWELLQKRGPKGFFNAKGQRQRLYDGLVDQLNGYDYEAEIIGYMKWFWCEHPIRINGIPDTDAENICKGLMAQERWLKENVY